MSSERESDSAPGALSGRERAILEYCAGGLCDQEIAIKLRLSVGEVWVLRRQAAEKLSARIASAHPFQIHEVVLAGSLTAGKTITSAPAAASTGPCGPPPDARQRTLAGKFP
jgi:DNA-binding CsgD family transcriptional regulator